MERDYKELKGCEICHKNFSISRIRHKCKRCKLIICSDCGKTKSIIIGYKKSPNQTHRICNYCRDDVTSQQDIKTRYGTSWATLSQLGVEWLNATNAVQELGMQGLNLYFRYLEDSETKENLKGIITELLDDISQGRSDRESYNFSLTEFLFYSQQGKEREAVRTNVEHVLRAYYARYPDSGYCSLLTNVATFLLCFLDEESAFYLLCYINERIVPDDFWNAASAPVPFVGLYREKYILKHAVRNILEPSISDLKPFEIVYKKVANVMIGALLVDTVNFNTLIYTWNEMFFNKSLRSFENCVIKVLAHARNYYEQFYNLSLYNFRIYACRNIHSELLKSDTALQLWDDDKNRFTEIFDLNVLNKLSNTNQILNDTLDRLKHLQQEEVNTILTRIRFLIQNARAERREERNYIELNQQTFVSIFREVGSLSDLSEDKLLNIFECLDILKKGHVSSRVVAGLVILLIGDDLNAKLLNVFALFDVDNDQKLNAKEIPQVISFLAEILPVLNEANPSYLNFQVHLYEMLERLRHRAKKMEKITPEDFQAAIVRYPVFQVVTGQRGNFRRGESLISEYSMDDDDDASPSPDLPQEGEGFKEVLEKEEREEKIEEAVVEEVVHKEENVEHKADTTLAHTEHEVENEFVNNNVIKPHIVPTSTKIQKDVRPLEKDNSCQMCNMF